MALTKLDPQLRLALQRQEGSADFLVSVRISTSADAEARLRLAHLLNRTVRPGAPIVAGRVDRTRLLALDADPAVVAVRLSRQLNPLDS